MNPLTGATPLLNVTASIASSMYPVPYPRFPSTLDLIICLTDITGAPVTDLQESEVTIVIAGQGMEYTPKIIYSAQAPAHDENGDPLLDGDGNPIMVPVPGPARQAGLSGYYRISVLLTSGLPVGHVTGEIVVGRDASQGQTLTPFDIAV